MGKALDIWLHPRRTMEELDELTIANADLSARLERSTEELRLGEEELTAERASASELRCKVGELQEELDRRDEELRDLRDRLDEWKDMDRRVSEFERGLTAVEDMKRHYEDRIGRLRAKIIEMRESGRKEEVNHAGGKTPVIDMTLAAPLADDDPDADWLQPLP